MSFSNIIHNFSRLKVFFQDVLTFSYFWFVDDDYASSLKKNLLTPHYSTHTAVVLFSIARAYRPHQSVICTIHTSSLPILKCHIHVNTPSTHDTPFLKLKIVQQYKKNALIISRSKYKNYLVLRKWRSMSSSDSFKSFCSLDIVFYLQFFSGSHGHINKQSFCQVTMLPLSR